MQIKYQHLTNIKFEMNLITQNIYQTVCATTVPQSWIDKINKKTIIRGIGVVEICNMNSTIHPSINYLTLISD